MENQHNNLEQKARQAYHQQIASLDSKTLQQLRKARELALAEQSKSWWQHRRIKWLTGTGAGLALATVMTFFVVPNLITQEPITPLEDIELLSAETDLDLITDFEFYEWLDESKLNIPEDDINS